jgi:hypothetical protein
MDASSGAILSAMVPRPWDFAGYWTLGRLIATGTPSYDPAQVLALQQGIGWQAPFANLVWYAPWSLPIFWLFGLLPYVVAMPLWLVSQIGLVLLATDRLWRHHGGARSGRVVAALVAMTFYPTIALVIWRQASALALVGIVGFLVCSRRRHDLRAGLWLALATVKPQLLYLFWLALALWVWRLQRWRVALGCLLGCAAGLALAALLDWPLLLAYCQHLVSHPPDEHIAPSLGGLLRLTFGAHHYWLQFAPALLGVAWLVYWLRRHRDEDIDAQTPTLILASFLCGIFFWTPDLVLLLVAAIPLAARLTDGGTRRTERGCVIAFAAITAVALVMHERVADHWFYWLPVAYAVLFGLARLRVQGNGGLPPGSLDRSPR